MPQLFIFEKATSRVVAIFDGPDGASCEFAAGYADSQGNRPYCSSKLEWMAVDGNGRTTHHRVDLVGIGDAPIFSAPQLDFAAAVSGDLGLAPEPRFVDAAQVTARRPEYSETRHYPEKEAK
jgi:hypothetical protein